MRQGFIPILTIFIILAALPALSQEATEVLTATASPSMLVEVTPELTAELSSTAIPTLTPSPSPTAIPLEVTAEVTAEATEALAESTAEVTEYPVESTAEATETSSAAPESTNAFEVTAEVTEAAESTATASPALDIDLMVLRGEVQFQNRPEHSRILIRVLTLDGQLVSEAESNERGVFSLPAPAEMPFILLIEAPLHRAIRLELLPSDAMPSVILAGGDLDNDGCINDSDMQALLLHYGFADTPTTDINADGRTDLADLAILTGNFSRDCGVLAESTESPALE